MAFPPLCIGLSNKRHKIFALVSQLQHYSMKSVDAYTEALEIKLNVLFHGTSSLTKQVVEARTLSQRRSMKTENLMCSLKPHMELLRGLTLHFPAEDA